MRALLCLMLAWAPACTIYHHCDARDRALLDEEAAPFSSPPPGASPVPHRVVPAGDAHGFAGQGVFTHASQYRPAPGVSVDFGREEVVRISARGLSRASLRWIGETADELLVAVVVPAEPCTAYPSPSPEVGSIDVVVPLTTKHVRRVTRRSGPQCELRGQP